MIDWFVILTPVLLLAVIALLSFVGCDSVFGIHSTGLAPANLEAGYVNTAVYVEPATSNGGADKTTFPATLTGLQGGELIVLALQWDGNPPTFTPGLTPAAAAYRWQITTTAPPKTITSFQVFTAINPAAQNQFTVQVQLNSVKAWSISLSAFNNVDVNSPTSSPQTITSSPNTPVSSLQTAPISVAAGDALYGFGLAADGNGNFPSGNNNLGLGPGFTLDDPSLTQGNPGDPTPLVEHLTTDNFGKSQSLPAVVVNNTGNPNLLVFGMAINATPW